MSANPVPHLPALPRTLLSARLSRSAAIAQLYPPPAPVLLHHFGAVKPLRTDTPVASHIHLATAPQSGRTRCGVDSLMRHVPPSPFALPWSIVAPCRPLPRCPLPAPSVLRSLLAFLDPCPPHMPSPSQLRASPAPRLHPLRPTLYTPNRTSRVVSASPDPPYRIPTSTSGPLTHHPLYHNSAVMLPSGFLVLTALLPVLSVNWPGPISRRTTPLLPGRDAPELTGPPAPLSLSTPVGSGLTKAPVER
ncbi:hypothetical protein B0H14DRAFT_3464077 [Mycena olivaceomarginata]|nr:hypothetical protein B0H14DRAFT_3464077 [Mycena olivaceomarginata]